jgi:hypothetical protein
VVEGSSAVNRFLLTSIAGHTQRSRCNIPEFGIVVTSQMLCNQTMKQVSLLMNSRCLKCPNNFQRRAYTPGAHSSIEFLSKLYTF